MAKRIKLFYIGWRGNPQLRNGGYYKMYGQLSKAEASRKEKCVYGTMTLYPFETEEQYNGFIEKVKNEGYSIQ
jgi:hypothetical protein